MESHRPAPFPARLRAAASPSARGFDALLGILLVAGVACGGDDDRPPGNSDAGPLPVDASSPADAEGPGEDGGSRDAGPARGLSFLFDYRFDTRGFFDAPERRAALEQAGAVWSAILLDDFAPIPAGTPVRTRDPENPDASGMNLDLEAELDDVIVFVGCAPVGGRGTARSNHAAAFATIRDAELLGTLMERYGGSDFEPWSGWISFDCDSLWHFDATPETSDDIPPTAVDFLSTAAHELAHVLGFGTSDAFDALSGSGAFEGGSAVTLYGGPVPLTPDRVHLDAAVRPEGQSLLMAPSRWVGTRRAPATLEALVMADIGYEIAP